jgi:regulatory protein
MNRTTPDEAKAKIIRYCAYQERSHKEVKEKLFGFGLYSTEVNELLSFLITEGFLNEERFAKAFAGGKFRMKKWGRIKIIRALENHDLTANCIKIGLKEIDEQEYVASLNEIILRKARLVDDPNAFVRRDKVARFAIQKGYEPELVWREVKRQIPK